MTAVSASGTLEGRAGGKASKALSFTFGVDFPPELEAEYQRSILETKMSLCRLGAILGLILNVVYTVWDWLVFEAAFEQVTLIRQIFASAFLVFAIGLSLGGTTGYAINPARDLGPRLAHALLPIPGKRDSDWSYAWAPVVGPILGGLLAAWVHSLIK